MIHLQLRLLCQTCSDKRKVQRLRDDANRISLRMVDLIEDRSIFEKTSAWNSQYFHSAARCRMSGGTCNQMLSYERELRLAERELDRVFGYFLKYLEGIEKKEAGSLKQKAFDLLRGHYPQAAGLIQP